MRILVCCGFHANETAGVRICHDWTHSAIRKKDGIVYKELSKLAGRTITSKEVEFVNLSRYNHHNLAKEFLRKYPLHKLLNIYNGSQQKKFPKRYRQLLRQYLSLWDGLDPADRDQRSLLVEKAEILANLAMNENAHKSRDRLDFLFPDEFHTYVQHRLGWANNQAGNYVRNPAILEKLAADQNAVILDLHCANADSSPIKRPWVTQDVYTDPRARDGRPEKLLKLLHKYELPGEPLSRYGTCEAFKTFYRLYVFLIEIPAKYSDIPDTALYRSLVSSGGWCKILEERNFEWPNVAFIELLYLVFNRALYGEVNADMFWDSFLYTIEGRERYVDPSFYRSDDYNDAKRFIANIIREILEWNEKYEANPKSPRRNNGGHQLPHPYVPTFPERLK